MIKPAAVVLDSDPARRNSLVRSLYGAAWHVEPYESFEELRAFWPSASLVIAHDDDAAPRQIFDLLLERGRWQPIVFYAVEPEPSRIVDVILMGAMDYLAWPFPDAVLNERLRLVEARRTSFAELRQKSSRSRKLVASLTQREREVLLSLAQGASNKSIAQDLQISPRTIEIHRARMMGKLGVKHVGEAISIALYADLSNAPSEDESLGTFSFNG
ncbi:MAG TPA: LuxR C-terminal-related transcriptional regulator [Croceibacterium sp.]